MIVTSTPAAADIWLDRVPIGRITPDTLREVPAGPHVVRVVRDGFVAAPESLQIELSPADTAEAEFALTAIEQGPPRIVLLEGFSNVDCAGCPQMAATLLSLMSEPAHGLDRVLLIKYAANWPALDDPHYLANPAANEARLAFYLPYLSVGIPTLAANGALAGASGTPPSLDDLRALVEGLLQGSPGFSIAVTASVPARGTAVLATATLHATQAVDRPGAVLNFALVQNPVLYGSAPGSQGETEFHWVMRDFVASAEPPLPLAGAEDRILNANLLRQAGWSADQLFVIAFVQDPTTREVLQAGMGTVTATLAGAGTSQDPPHASDTAAHASPQPRGSP